MKFHLLFFGAFLLAFTNAAFAKDVIQKLQVCTVDEIKKMKQDSISQEELFNDEGETVGWIANTKDDESKAEFPSSLNLCGLISGHYYIDDLKSLKSWIPKKNRKTKRISDLYNDEESVTMISKRIALDLQRNISMLEIRITVRSDSESDKIVAKGLFYLNVRGD